MKFQQQFEGECETAVWPGCASALGNAALTDAVSNTKKRGIDIRRGQTESNR